MDLPEGIPLSINDEKDNRLEDEIKEEVQTLREEAESESEEEDDNPPWEGRLRNRHTKGVTFHPSTNTISSE